MKEGFEEPKSPEEKVAGKKEELLKTIDLMLDFKKSAALTALVNEYNDLTGEEIDFIAEYVRLTDFQVGQRGPFAETAKKGIVEIQKNLEEMKEKVRPEIIKKLEFLGLFSKYL